MVRYTWLSRSFGSCVGLYGKNVAKFVSEKSLVESDGAQKSGAFGPLYRFPAHSPPIRERFPRQQLFR